MKNLPTGREIPSGSGSQISNTRWVDVGTTVAPGEQDGSIGAPFSTIQAGLTALAALPGTVANLQVFPGAYGEASPTWAGLQTLHIGNAVGAAWNYVNGTIPNLPILTNKIFLQGVVAISGLELSAGYEHAGVSGSVDVFGSKVWLEATCPLNRCFKQCFLIAVVAGSGSLQMDGCLISGGHFTVDGDAYATNCRADGSGAQEFTFSPLAGELFVDGMYDFYFVANTGVINNGTKTILA